MVDFVFYEDSKGGTYGFDSLDEVARKAMQQDDNGFNLTTYLIEIEGKPSYYQLHVNDKPYTGMLYQTYVDQQYESELDAYADIDKICLSYLYDQHDDPIVICKYYKGNVN